MDITYVVWLPDRGEYLGDGDRWCEYATAAEAEAAGKRTGEAYKVDALGAEREFMVRRPRVWVGEMG